MKNISCGKLQICKGEPITMENKKPGLFARLQNKITRSYGIALVVLLALMVVLSLTTDGNFLTYENIFNLSRATSVYGIVALAMTFVIITGGIDLSVGANVRPCGYAGDIADGKSRVQYVVDHADCGGSVRYGRAFERNPHLRWKAAPVYCHAWLHDHNPRCHFIDFGFPKYYRFA